MLRYLMMITKTSKIDLARMTGYSARTINNWLTARSPTPRVVINYLRLRAGDLGAASEDWDGWRIGTDGLMYSPEDWRMSPYNVRAGHFLIQNSRHDVIMATCRANGIEQPPQLRECSAVSAASAAKR